MRPRQTLTQRADSGLSTASLSAAEGDDLLRARQFCQQAEAEMTAIIAADRGPNPMTAGGLREGRDPVWLCERLCVIQRGAKRARARAIYRSAQDVLGLIQRQNAHMPIDWTRVDGRLFVLNKLLGQYESGLSQVEPDIISPQESQESVATDASVRFDPLEAMARETLETLLPHASKTEQAALKRLIDYTPDLVPPTEIPSQQSSDRLAHVLPDLVQNLLEVGREYGKTLSVSHSLDDLLVAEGTASDIAHQLLQTLSNLIASNLPLQGVGRLDIAPSTEGLRISGSGFETFDMGLPQKDESPIEDVIVPRQQVQPEPDQPQTVEHNTPPKPRINDDTEADLRDQLAALMDGGMSQI